MKKFFSSLVFFVFLTNVSAQIEVNSSNQVGIGTTNPQYKLHVVGDTYTTGNFYLGSKSSFLGTTGNVPVIFNVDNILSGSTGTSSNTNVVFGYSAFYSGWGSKDTAIGHAALFSSLGNTENTAVGYSALYSSTTGSYNTAIGHLSLYSNTVGGWNTAIGSYALYSNTGGWTNTATGYQALCFNTVGASNTANGYQALYSNTEGTSNTATGYSALYSNTEGTSNTATGQAALKYNTTGTNNTANGYLALHFNTTGSYNTAIGHEALNINNGNYNTAIGTAAGNSSNMNNTTAIGYNARATASDQVRIGNSSVNSIGGCVAWSTISDGRAKKNIRANVPGLAFINSLQPVTYNLDLDAIDDLIKYEQPEISDEDGNIIKSVKSQELVEIERKSREAKERQVQTGFVAQDVEETAKSLGYDFSGVDVDETGIYSLRYAEFVVPLVKAVQELSEQNSRMQERINELNKKIELLEKE